MHSEYRTDPQRHLLDLLVCPVCGGRLEPVEGAAQCARRHTFNRARQGYLSLPVGNTQQAADTSAMVQAREEFLTAGHYGPLAAALAGAAAARAPQNAAVLDAGTGTGHYLAAVLDALPDAVGLGLDTSKFALRRAARAHPRAAAASGDVWRPLPVRTGAFDLVLDVFAPRNGPEFHRALRPGGAVLVVTPTPRHLAELRRQTGMLSVDGAKEERLQRALGEDFTQVGEEQVEFELVLAPDDLHRLAAMGPTGHHVAPAELRRRVEALGDRFEVTASLRLSVHEAR
ncbi:methyltransferase domain-containing protein [Streptomyces sulphureus]|uniref:methyltransferase domain-containing protein n=1 Tax=Streptomyces sulphureus TaxID=47758 RepID=UPI000382B77B|nr:methyltransferase domain-containing protein [Streptomyces sulphureus]